MSALSVVNLLHLGQTHCLHCRLTLLILLLSCANDCIITYYDICNMLQLWYLITISLFHELLILCFNQQFFSFGGTSLSEFKRIKTFVILNVSKILNKLVSTIIFPQTNIQYLDDRC